MTNAFSTARAANSSAAAPWSRVVDLAIRLFAALARRSRLRRDEAFLLGQPDYMLRDIGIGRSEIYTAIHSRDRFERGIKDTDYGTRR